MSKLLIICGPTATGKTNLGVQLAKKFNGEIISADSRQVYRGMDIGTGKDLPLSAKFKNQSSKLQIKSKKLQVGFREKEGIPIWLVDIVEPDYWFNVGEYAELARKVIENIYSRNKLPIIVGGTGLYVRSIVEPLGQINIPPDQELRKKLDTMSVQRLQMELIRLNNAKFEHMNDSDRQNPRRLVRAIEIVNWNRNQVERHPELVSGSSLRKMLNRVQHDEAQDILWIGLTSPKKILLKRINERVEERLHAGMVDEVKNLMRSGYNKALPAMTATGYRQVADYLSDKKTLPEAIIEWKQDEHKYAKRQLTWFKKYAQIHWFEIDKKGYPDSIFHEVAKWYNSQ